MRCSKTQKQLNRYSDAELPPEAREEIERHLATCADCRTALKELEAAGDLWTALDKPPLPEGFANRVMLAARQHAAPRTQRTQRWWDFAERWWREQSLAMQAAVTAVLVAGSLVGWSFSESLPLPGSSAGPDGRIDAAGTAMEHMSILGGAPDGSLEQTYLAWAFPPEALGDSR